tara:strand:+ start:7362 stop:7775 length:414 start_codon:yes stop_codon:yes gene_type:complete
MKLALIILIVFVAAVFLKLRPSFGQAHELRKKNTSKNKKTLRESTKKINSLYHAVNIEFDIASCPAVQSITEQYFLAREAPPIPLPECTAETCHCRYRHHNGRRHGIRRPQTVLSAEAYQSSGREERRIQKGRRAAD